ncbi:MAG: septum formation initiator family protein [Ruminococcaceae bacterium]|nr:septum formation initiator family protein [Oscillospiraceae bacterium]
MVPCAGREHWLFCIQPDGGCACDADHGVGAGACTRGALYALESDAVLPAAAGISCGSSTDSSDCRRHPTACRPISPEEQNANGTTKKEQNIMAKKQKQPKKKTSFFTKVALFVFVGFCAITIFQLYGQITEYKEEIAVTEEQIAYYQAQIEALNRELATPIDYTYIRKIAKSKLNFSMPDDIIFYNDLSN